jgi:PKD repeat protein
MKLLVSLFAITLIGTTSFGQCNAYVTASANPMNPNDVTFNNQSTAGAGAYYILTTGDGSTYTLNGFLNSITHLYTQPGAYEYCISIYDSITPCYDTYCDSIYINTVANPNCDGYFTYLNQQTAYDFDFTSAGANTVNVTHAWTFGDGNTSSLENPSHTYMSNGAYEVCHTVTDVNGNCTDTYCDSVYVNTNPNPGPCQSSFYWYQDSSTTQTVMMFNNSNGNALSYYWDFGDGNTSTQAYPTHQYQSTGIFYVCLTITDNNPLMPCTSTYCDSVWVTFKAQGFTINVYPGSVAGIEYAEESQLSFYPNPVNNILTIESEESGSVILMDLNGKVILDKKIDAGESQLDLTAIESGVYLLSIGDRVERIIKL